MLIERQKGPYHAAVLIPDGLGLQLQPNLFKTAIRWLLGTSHMACPDGKSLVCPLCSDKALHKLVHNLQPASVEVMKLIGITCFEMNCSMHYVLISSP